MDIHHSFAGTDLGEKLGAQIRYEKYKPEEVSDERWVELLGADVNNLTHLPLTYGLTRVFVSKLRRQHPGLLNEHEEQVLQTTALVHDWAEVIVGDISYGDKTKENEAKEHKHLFEIANRFGEGKLGELIDEAVDDVVFNPEGKLGHIFNTVERTGYVRTGIRASQYVISKTAPDCDAGLRWIAADVLGNQPVPLLERVDTYKPLKGYLKKQTPAISNGFEVVGVEVFENYPAHERNAKLENFNQSYDAWLSWAS